jgi:hypothetical protein
VAAAPIASIKAFCVSPLGADWARRINKLIVA